MAQTRGRKHTGVCFATSVVSRRVLPVAPMAGLKHLLSAAFVCLLVTRPVLAEPLRVPFDFSRSEIAVAATEQGDRSTTPGRTCDGDHCSRHPVFMARAPFDLPARS